MAGYSLYDTYVLHWSTGLAALDSILTKAEAHAKEKGIDAETEYINAKLYEDMRPLPFQVQILTFSIKLPLSLLVGNAPEWENDLKTFADLHARIKSAQDYVNSVKPEDINGREDEILKPLGPLSSTFPDGLSAKAIFENFSTPNLYFHLVTTYDILRNQGVPLGKSDYLKPFFAALA